LPLHPMTTTGSATGSECGSRRYEGIRPMRVGAGDTFENAKVDHYPDDVDHGDQQQEAPPARLATVVTALDAHAHAAIGQPEPDHRADNGIAEQGAVEGVGDEQDDGGDPEWLAVDATLPAQEQFLPI